MGLMTPELGALRRALHARQMVPRFVSWAARRRLEATDLDVRSMRDWAQVIVDSDDLAKIFARVPSRPLDAWHALEPQFSTRLHHHHALLFDRLAHRLEEERDFDDARRLAAWSRSAWDHVLADPDYVPDLLARVAPEEEFSPEEVFTAEFERRVQTLIDMLDAAFQTEALDPADLDRSLAAYAHGALEDWATSEFEVSSPVGLAASARRRIARRPLEIFDEWFDNLNFAEAPRRAITRPFAWLRRAYEAIGFDAQTCSEVVTRTVETIWTLRRLENDVEATLNGILEEAAPFNERLICGLANAELFGHNARSADFLVFQGERVSDRDRRIEIFGRALEICPGHRNSAKLLSHEYLWDVESILLKIEAISSFTTGIGPVRRRAERLLDEADQALDRVEDTFAFNESIPEKREEIDRHRFRLDIPRKRNA